MLLLLLLKHFIGAQESSRRHSMRTMVRTQLTEDSCAVALNSSTAFKVASLSSLPMIS